MNRGQEKNRLGLLSKYNLNQLEIAAKQAQDNVALLEASVEQLYIKLNDLMGEKADAVLNMSMTLPIRLIS